MGKVMTVDLHREDVIKVMSFAGWKTVASWTNDRLASKMEDLVELVEGDDPPEDEDVARVLLDIQAGVESKAEFIVHDEPVAEDDEEEESQEDVGEEAEDYYSGDTPPEPPESEDDDEDEWEDDDSGDDLEASDGDGDDGDEEPEEIDEEVPEPATDDESDDEKQESEPEPEEEKSERPKAANPAAVIHREVQEDEIEPEPEPEPEPKPLNVRVANTRTRVVGVVLKKHGLEKGVTEEMIDEVDAMFGTKNYRQSSMKLVDAWHILQGYENGLLEN